MHQESREFAIENSTGDTKTEPPEDFNFQVIPVENSLKGVTKDETRKSLTVEVSSEFRDYIDMNPNFQDFRTESENSSIEDLNIFENQDLELASLGTEDHSLHFFDQSSLIENEKDYFLDINETSVLRGNHSVQVKKGFDGSNYVIDLMVGCPDERNMENVVSRVLETELFNEESNQEVETQASECLIVINSSPIEEKQVSGNSEIERRDMCDTNAVEEFYDSITTYLGL